MTRLSEYPLANTNLSAKAEIRRRVLDGLADVPRVLDCFAGAGEIWRAIYREYEYLGLDTERFTDERRMICIDNREFLREVDLAQWNVFDLDAYGDPWDQFAIICRRRKIRDRESIAIFVTDSLIVATKMSGRSLSRETKKIVGLPRAGDPGGWLKIPCLNRHVAHIRDLLVRKGLDSMHARIIESWHGRGKTGAGVFYGGLLLGANR